jgi:hypothetical protein
LGSAIYVAMHKEEPAKASAREEGDEDEERGLMMADMDGLRDGLRDGAVTDTRV